VAQGIGPEFKLQHPAPKNTRRMAVQVGLGKKFSKITRAQRTGSVAQIVECLSGKHETVSSNPRTTKLIIKKKKKKKTQNKILHCKMSTLVYAYSHSYSGTSRKTT
jgi:hypothetical protein